MCHRHDTPQEGLDTAPEQVNIAVESGDALPASYHPPPSGAGPPVLLIPDIYGANTFYHAVAARLAHENHGVLLPDYFFRAGQLEHGTREEAFDRYSKLAERTALEDLDTALDWLAAQSETVGERMGALGFCLGGTLALDLAARRTDLETVCYYAFPFGMSRPNPEPADRPIDLTARMSGHVLAFWGEDDYIGTEQMHQYHEAMRAAGVSYEHRIYPHVGHGFLRGLFGDGAEHEAATDSWNATTKFFDEHLR